MALKKYRLDLMLEENRLERGALQDLMQKNKDVMLTVVSTLRSMGEVMMSGQQEGPSHEMLFITPWKPQST